MAEKRLCFVAECRGPREKKIIGRKRSRQADDDNPGAREKCPFAEIILGIDDFPNGAEPEDHPPSDLYASTGQPACYKTLFFNVPKKWYYIHPSNGFYFGFNYKMKGPCEVMPRTYSVPASWHVCCRWLWAAPLEGSPSSSGDCCSV